MYWAYSQAEKFTVGLACMHISICVIFIFANVSHEMTTSSANHQLAFVCNRSSVLHMHTTTQSDTQFSPSNVTKKFIDKFSPGFFSYIQLNRNEEKEEESKKSSFFLSY